MKYFFSFYILLLSLFLGFSTTVCAQTTTAVVTHTPTANVQSLTVKVTGIGCNTDVRTISAALVKLAGVNTCEVAKRGAVTRFIVAYDPVLICAEDIYEVVEDTPGCKNPDDRPYRVKL